MTTETASIFVVTFEPDPENGGVGGVQWFYPEYFAAAERFYEEQAQIVRVEGGAATLYLWETDKNLIDCRDTDALDEETETFVSDLGEESPRSTRIKGTQAAAHAHQWAAGDDRCGVCAAWKHAEHRLRYVHVVSGVKTFAFTTNNYGDAAVDWDHGDDSNLDVVDSYFHCMDCQSFVASLSIPGLSEEWQAV